MDNKLRRGKYSRYVILIFFAVILSTILAFFDVNIITDLFYNVVIDSNSNNFLPEDVDLLKSALILAINSALLNGFVI